MPTQAITPPSPPVVGTFQFLVAPAPYTQVGLGWLVRLADLSPGVFTQDSLSTFLTILRSATLLTL